MPSKRKVTKNEKEKENINPNSPDFIETGKSSSIHEVQSPKSIIKSNTDILSPRRLITPNTKLIDSPRIYLSPQRRNNTSIPGTPIRQRADVKVDSHLRQIQLSVEKLAEEESEQINTKLVVWGTDVVLNESKLGLKDFIETWLPDESLKDLYNPKRPLYIQKLEEIEITHNPFIIVDAKHLKCFNQNLYNQLICYPQEIIPAFDNVMNDYFFTAFPNIVLEHQIQVRIMNIDKTRNMRNLNPDDIDQLISINGMVIRCSTVIPDIQSAFYKCYVCKNEITVDSNINKFSMPTVCSNCNGTRTMTLVHNRCLFSDKQLIKLQECPDEMPPGQTPFTVLLSAHGGLVDQISPGDRVTVTGVYRAVPIKINPRNRTIKSVYRTYIDVIHFLKNENIGLRPECESNDDILNLSKERIEEIIKLSKEENIYHILSSSLAPSIYGNLDVKKGILLQLFGATRKEFDNVGRSHFRSEINILLCGDPGTCKSQILKYVYDLLPRGQYTSGKGSSAVGLTAYITRDPDTKQLVLQTGALVLSDNGICCIDEFDKMNESTRSVLHEVMEHQTLSIAKAGIICQLNARTSVLAAANPVKSKWDTKLTTIANIQMPHTLLSRFDLIFLILDKQSTDFDHDLAQHLVSIYTVSGNDDHSNQGFIDISLLRDYISYARLNIQPKLTQQSAEHLVQNYLQMRKSGGQHGSVSAYPRQLESLIRLSESHAKMRLSLTVDPCDVYEAIRLYREALMQSSIDPNTGMIDVNILAAGYTESDRKLQFELTTAIKSYLISQSKYQITYTNQQLFEAIKKSFKSTLSLDMLNTALHALQDDHIISILDNKTVRYIVP